MLQVSNTSNEVWFPATLPQGLLLLFLIIIIIIIMVYSLSSKNLQSFKMLDVMWTTSNGYPIILFHDFNMDRYAFLWERFGHPEWNCRV